MKKCFLLILILGSFKANYAQQLDETINDTTIKSALLFPTGNQMAFPLIRLNTQEQLELHFDDLKAGYKNYYYTYQLCNADWTPALVTYFDYIKGFNNNRVNTFRNSNYAQTKYTHYQVNLPEKNSTLIKSGNYILKVYTDNDTSKLVFTKKFVVVDEKITAAGQMLQPLGQNVFNSHQRIIVRLNTQSLNITNAHQQLKVVVLQNQRWQNQPKNVLPTFVRGKDIEYNTESDLVFPAGREWRWVDLRSFRFLSDRVATGEFGKGKNWLKLKTDGSRNNLRYTFFKDINGLYTLETTDNINPYWQADYATVHFSYKPNNADDLLNKDLYVVGKFNNYQLTEANKMKKNAETGVYENAYFLKQGFYNYQYVQIANNEKMQTLNWQGTEGNYWEAENTYQVLVYYRPFGARYDELIGYTATSSLNGRVGPGY
jgi:hypothetical protein